MPAIDIHELVVGKNASDVIDLLKLIVLSNQSTFVTGASNSGRTSLLTALYQFLPKTTRVYMPQSSSLSNALGAFDLISCEGCLTRDQRINWRKKTSIDVTFIDEYSSSEDYVFLAHTPVNKRHFVLGTHFTHAAAILITECSCVLMQAYNFTSAKHAIDRVVQALRFDVHVERNRNGLCHISRITEIVPGNGKGMYYENTIVKYEDNAYVLMNPFSDKTKAAMLERLPEGLREAFLLLLVKFRNAELNAYGKEFT